MFVKTPAYPYSLRLNADSDPGAAYGPGQARVIGDESYRSAMAGIGAWPGYRRSPLVRLDGLAAAAGLGAVFYKDESERFGLGSFKALGGSYAVARLLVARVAAKTGDTGLTMEDLLAGRHGDAVAGITVCCATDGNHGRSVAWGARMFGCDCVIFIHETVSDGRRAAIEELGARVVRTAGNYDHSVRQAQQVAGREGWFVVSDTSYEGYMDVPRDVMAGYTVMAQETIDQLPPGQPPTHLFLQTGVGGMAAALTARFWQVFGDRRPRTVLVDPERAACWMASFAAGRPVAIDGDLDTMMAGLACGEVSLLAWEILAPAAAAAITVNDAAAADCMIMLADGRYGDGPLVAGESAVAGLAGLLAAAADSDGRAKLGLDKNSRVVLFGTEGDTDPEVYRRIVGRSAAAVRGR